MKESKKDLFETALTDGVPATSGLFYPNVNSSVWAKKHANYLTMKGTSKDPQKRKAAKAARKARRKNR